MLEGALVIAPPGVHLGECQSDLNGHPSPRILPPLPDPPTFSHWCHAYAGSVPIAGGISGGARVRCRITPQTRAGGGRFRPELACQACPHGGGGGDPRSPHAQGLPARAGPTRASGRAARPGRLGAEPQPDQPVALPRRRPCGARGAEGGGRPGVRVEARPRADAGRRVTARRWRGPDPGRGGPRRDGGRDLHRPAGRARARPRRLLAHTRGAARAGRPRGRRSAGRRARARPDPPRLPLPGKAAARAGPVVRVRNVSAVIARDDALAAFEDEGFDMVVIGGGITGAGVALDAASRGYSVALVEREDWAAGTWSRSSKLVHGGLRYLQNFDLGLVREALLERALMTNLAPHLVRPLPLLVPGFEGKRPDRLTGVGLNMYDVMATDRLRRRRSTSEEWIPDRHRIISAEEVVELVPALAKRDQSGAYLFYDCQTDDVRLVLTVLGEAERFGAVLANRCEVVSLVEEDGRARGVLCDDRLGGRSFEIRADNVVNATGVWADRINGEELYAEEEMPRIRPSRGTHITLSAERVPMVAGAIVPAGSGRSIFALPWLGRTLVGTTDNDYDGPLEHVPPDPDDVDYLLDACNAFFGESLTAADVTGAYAGVRPLISSGDPKKSVDISRKAELYETSSGLVTITGGKLTTWRRMAKLAVDRIVEREGRDASCRTHEIPHGQPAEPEDLPPGVGVDDASLALLAHRYGYAAREVLAVAEERPELAGRIVPDLPDLLAEAPFSVRHEQAATLADVLLRGTRLGLLEARTLVDPSGPARVVAEAMSPELAWDPARVDLEVERWLEVAREEGIAMPVAAA